MRLAVWVLLLAASGCASGGVPGERVGAAVLVARPEGGVGGYVGNEACRTCHPEAWAAWRATGHARPYAGLPAGKRGDSRCLRCHVTAFDASQGYRAAGALVDLAAVGCEACHGPGADHAGSRYPGFVPTATGGECPPCEANRICRLCHTPAHSPQFELARALSRVSCRGAGDDRAGGERR